MATSAISTAPLYQSSIGKKAVMAASGGLLFLFVLGHMIGNLQVFLGPEKLNAYAKFLHSSKALLWAVRIGLLTIAGLHIYSALQTYLVSRRARPRGYHNQRMQAATASSRTMRWGGLAILFFLVYHLMHLTWGNAHQNFTRDVYCNVVSGFSIWWVSAIYIVANIFLGLHLFHGLWSLFQTLGINSPRWNDRLETFARGAATLVVIGNISMPVAVLTGLIPSAGIC